MIVLLMATAASAAGPIKSINGSLGSGGTSGDFVFVVSGDNRPTAKGAPYPHVLKTLLSEIRLIHPDLVLWTGDTVYGYRDTPAELKREYDAFLQRAKVADVPIFNAPGNHEIHGDKPCTDHDPETQFTDHFGALYGSFDYRGVHFIALDSEQCGHTTSDPNVQLIDGPQLEWLQQDLEANKDARAIFIFFHTEVTPAPNDEDAANHKPLGNSAELRALFEKYRVKAVFQGHEHLFYDTTIDNVRYFVAGGGGAPMYAPPEKGGFSHYLVVEMKGDQPTYKVVEPGHLYPETVDGNLWLINSSNTPLPVRRMEATVPASLGTCAELTVETRLTKWDKTPIPVPMQITKCTTSGGHRELTLAATDQVPRRSSVPVFVVKRH